MNTTKIKTTIELDFENEQVVFLITDIEQLQRIVTAYQVNINGSIIYRLAQGVNESWHYPCEIATDKNFLI